MFVDGIFLEGLTTLCRKLRAQGEDSQGDSSMPKVLECIAQQASHYFLVANSKTTTTTTTY